MPEKDDFYSGLSMENITDSDYNHAKVIFDDFEIKQLGEYQDLSLKNDQLLLADNFEIFRKMCLEISIRLCIFFSVPVLAWQPALEKNKVKLDLLTNINML